MILIFIGILIGVLGVGGFFSVVGWFFTNHHLFDIIDWIIAIPIIIILVLVIGFMFYIVCWLLTDLFKWTIKTVRIRNHKKSKGLIEHE